MGGKSSKINYYKINEVIDIESKNNKYGHKLLLTDGTEKIIYLTIEEEKQFKSDLMYSNMFKPIIKFDYENIGDIKNYRYINNQDSLTHFTIEYYNGKSENAMLNSFQLDLFWSLFTKTQKGKEMKKRLTSLK